MKKSYSNFEDKPWKWSGKTIRKAYMTNLMQAIIEYGYKVKAIRFNDG